MPGSARRHRLRRAALAAAVIVPLAAGGAQFLDRSDATGAAGATTTEAVGAPVTTVLREPTPAELDLLHTAREFVLRDCMRDKGFVYQPVPRRPIAEAREFPLVLDDIDWARRHGYGSDLEAMAKENQRTDVNQRYFQSLPADRRARALAAANGARLQGMTARTPDGMEMTRSPEGCQSEADRTLYGDLPAWFQARTTLTALVPMASERAGAMPELSRAVRPWTACMRRAGHDFTSPAAIRAVLPVPRPRETALAVAEATCAQSSGLAATAKRLSRTSQTELYQRYQAEVNTAFRLQLGALPRARSIVAAG